MTDEPTPPTLGVVAISKNEERDLPGFFENLLPWVDEIVIVDDGSTDATAEIAGCYPDKVKFVSSPRQPDEYYSHQRNKGITLSDSDWLLHMDIDERVPPTLAAEIRQAVLLPKNDAYKFRRVNYFLNAPMHGGGWQDWNMVHLAKKEVFRFSGMYHEECVVDAPPSRIGQLTNPMWHLNDDSYNERMRKSNVYCHEQARRLEAKQIRLKWFHLLALPFADFIRKFILKKGFRDGTAGLLWALHAATASFRACALVWDQQNRVDRQLIENELQRQWSDALQTEPSLLRPANATSVGIES